jgi:hypothetical protein
MGKPRGLRTARKLKDHRREQRWHDKDYKKSHLGTRWKSNPFAGASHAKGIVLEKVYVDIFADKIFLFLFYFLVVSKLNSQIQPFVNAFVFN